jgi:hypothetical protein
MPGTSQQIVPIGQCFDYAIQLAKEHLKANDIVIGHGILSTQWDRPFWHAWVEDGERVFDWQRKDHMPDGMPMETFNDFYTKHFVRYYTPEQVLVEALRHGHKGPWVPDWEEMVEEERKRWEKPSKNPKPYRLADDPEWVGWLEERHDKMERRLGRFKVRAQLGLERKLLKFGPGHVLLPAHGDPNAQDLLKHGEFFMNASSMTPLMERHLSERREDVVSLREPQQDGTAGRPYMVDVRVVGEAPFDTHGDAARRWSEDQEKHTLWTGYAYWDGLWRQHSWVTDDEDGFIYDTAPAPGAYYGLGLTDTEAKRFLRQFGEPHVLELNPPRCALCGGPWHPATGFFVGHPQEHPVCGRCFTMEIIPTIKKQMERDIRVSTRLKKLALEERRRAKTEGRKPRFFTPRLPFYDYVPPPDDAEENQGHLQSVGEIAEQGFGFLEDYYPESASGELLKECPEEDRAYARDVVWCGRKGEMLRVGPDYLQHIWGNIFDPNKLAAVVTGVQQAPERIGFYAPVATVSKIDLTSVKESIEYDVDEGLDRPYTTGDEELDKYLVDPDEVLDTYAASWDYEEEEDDPDYKAARQNAKEEIERRLVEAVAHNEGDLGQWEVTVRNGNHRAFGALIAGEPYIFVWLDDNQLQELRHGTWPEPDASELREMLV